MDPHGRWEREVQRGNITCVSCILGDCHQATGQKMVFTKGYSGKQDQAPN